MIHERTRRHQRLLYRPGASLLLCVTFLCGCGGGDGGNPKTGGNPVGTSPTVNLEGSWKGTWTYTINGLRGNETVTGSFHQSGTTANGQLTAESGVNLNFVMDVSASPLKGNATLYSYGYGQSCSAAGTATGDASEGRLVLRVPTASSTACTWQGTENEVVLGR